MYNRIPKTTVAGEAPLQGTEVFDLISNVDILWDDDTTILWDDDTVIEWWAGTSYYPDTSIATTMPKTVLSGVA